MHCVFSYVIQSVRPEEQSQIESRITAILSQHQPNVRRLSSFYVVHVHDRQEWDMMLQALINLSNSVPGALHFIMSPPIDGGRYNGILPRGEWDEINNITESIG